MVFDDTLRNLKKHHFSSPLVRTTLYETPILGTSKDLLKLIVSKLCQIKKTLKYKLFLYNFISVLESQSMLLDIAHLQA
jgi:hypothetical protein